VASIRPPRAAVQAHLPRCQSLVLDATGAVLFDAPGLRGVCPLLAKTLRIAIIDHLVPREPAPAPPEPHRTHSRQWRTVVQEETSRLLTPITCAPELRERAAHLERKSRLWPVIAHLADQLKCTAQRFADGSATTRAPAAGCPAAVWVNLAARQKNSRAKGRFLPS
jgi:hypothetical protein